MMQPPVAVILLIELVAINKCRKTHTELSYRTKVVLTTALTLKTQLNIQTC